jgi:uncharacterized membrane protein
MLSVLIKWIHLLATVAWIGGMVTNFFIFRPILSKQLDQPALGRVMGSVMQRTRIVVYFAISIFILTGVLMVSMYGKTSGRMYVGDSWFIFFLAKMFLFLILVLLAVYAFEVLTPRVAKLAKEGPSPKLKRAQKNQRITGLATFVIGILILLLSASL